jgi:hypothetical protein
MNLEISPYKGVGGIKFDMPRDEVRKRIGGTFRSFTQWQDDEPLSDYYHDIGVFCYYDATDRLEAMEFTSPACPIIAGVELLGLSFKEAFDKLCALDNTAEKNNDGAIAPQLGVGIWDPSGGKSPRNLLKR